LTEHEGPTAGGGRLDFSYADARTWAPPEPYDLLLSNATLQWVPEHADRFPDWIAGLAPGGTFAFQVPGNFDSPSHQLMRELAHSARWKDRLAGILRHDDAVLTPEAYLARLTALGCTADVWETTYLHLLQGEDPVLDWVKGTGLRPVLTELGAEAEEFLTAYQTALREAYPAPGQGPVSPSRRISPVATKEACPVLTAVDHVQLAAPPGSEDLLRAYYIDVLGMTEIPKPPVLAARGGCWFQAGAVQLHLG